MPSILFAGAGAASIAAAAAVPEFCDVAVASRTPIGGAEVTRLCRFRRATRVVRPISYSAAAEGRWDLVVLSSRPGQTDPEILAFASRSAPVVATMSQVPGDLVALQELVPAAVIMAPSFLADAASRDPIQVAAWYPSRTLFRLAGSDGDVRWVAARLPGMVKPVSEQSVLVSAARTMPFMAELVARRGDWNALVRDLERPATAAAEAVAAVVGSPAGRPSLMIARAALEMIPALAPFDFRRYAAAHFTRHAEQTSAMLEAWSVMSRPRDTPALDELRAALLEQIR